LRIVEALGLRVGLKFVHNVKKFRKLVRPKGGCYCPVLI
jgi:hypothetical protein